MAKEARDELEEFQEGSRELEAELETQLEQAESRLKEQRSAAKQAADGETIRSGISWNSARENTIVR